MDLSIVTNTSLSNSESELPKYVWYHNAKENSLGIRNELVHN